MLSSWNRVGSAPPSLCLLLVSQTPGEELSHGLSEPQSLYPHNGAPLPKFSLLSGTAVQIKELTPPE